MSTDTVMFRMYSLINVWLISKQNLSSDSSVRPLPRNRWYVMDRGLTFHLQSEKMVVGLHYWAVIAKFRRSFFQITRKPIACYVKPKSWNLLLVSFFFYSEQWKKTLFALGSWPDWLLGIGCHFRTFYRRLSVSRLLIYPFKEKT